jgi:N-acetylmuramoyl-L-alanine amidase
MKNQKSFRIRVLLIFLAFVIIFSFSIFCFICFANQDLDLLSGSKEQISSIEHTDTPIVIIDAGHGGEDGGTVGVNRAYEKDINLSIAKKLDTFLRAAGIRTVMTRTEDILLYDRNTNYEGRKKVLDLAARLKISEEYENAIFVSIHMNAFPEAKYKGLQVYYSPNDPLSENLAQRIQVMTKEALMQENNRKIKSSGGKIFLLDRMKTPSVLIECGFLSNPEECERLCDEAYQNELATVISCAILDHIKEIHYQY